MSDHAIAWVHTLDSIIYRITCLAGPEDFCRQYCDGCESRTSLCGCYPGRIFNHPETEFKPHCVKGHPMPPGQECLYKTWIDEYEGAAALWRGSPDTPVHDGPIEFSWQIDYYAWNYVEES